MSELFWVDQAAKTFVLAYYGFAAAFILLYVYDWCRRRVFPKLRRTYRKLRNPVFYDEELKAFKTFMRGYQNYGILIDGSVGSNTFSNCYIQSSEQTMIKEDSK